MSPGVFTATMSFHGMLKRAQELSPVLTYVLCKLLVEAETKQQEASAETKRVRVDRCDDAFSYYFMLDQMQLFISQIFGNLTVRVAGPYGGTGDDGLYKMLVAHREFVNWLKELQLQFDDKRHAVTIPT